MRLKNAMAACFMLAATEAKAENLKGFESLYLPKGSVYVSALDGVPQKCGINEKSIENAILAELKRGKVKVSNNWDHGSAKVQMSFIVIRLQNSKLCALTIRLTVDAFATNIQGINDVRLVTLYNDLMLLTYPEFDGAAGYLSSVSELSKKLADKFIVDN